MIKRVLSAFSFITVIPVKTDYFGKYTVAFFPVVGMFIGSFLFLSNLLLLKIMPASLAAFLLLLLYVLITGGFHLDGFADTVDALSGSLKYKDKFFEIMSDSHIGMIGVLGLVLLLGADYLTIKVLIENNKAAVLAAAPAVTRLGMVFSIYIGRSAKKEGLGNFILRLADLKVLVFSLIITAGYAVIFVGLRDLAILFSLAALIPAVVVIYFNRKIGGITGDILGFINELTFAICLFTFAVINAYV